MKYIILIGDGMGDYPIEALGGLTPIEKASTPNLDRLAKEGLIARVRTTPEGLSPGSDVAIMTLMGYNPKGVLTGRGPLEAAALNIPLNPGDSAFRLNLVTLDLGDDIIMRNHAAGDITSPEAAELLEALTKNLPLKNRTVHQGVSYRNLLVWPDGADLNLPSLPPHDYRDQSVKKFLYDQALEPVMSLVKASWAVLDTHPVNQKRRAQNLPPANSIWLWGQGQAPKIRTYREKWGLSGATVSAVDIIRGLALYSGLEPLTVPGATGLLDTNYQGKVSAGLKALKEKDLVIIHLEAPDEMSHQGDLAAKLKAIENFDKLIVGPVLEGLRDMGPYRLMAACDHFTTLKLRTHSDDPVPMVFYDSTKPAASGTAGYSEKNSLASGRLIPDGPTLGEFIFGPERPL
ncbi:MAG: cofactor-independent phosphoglycerate mutase [Deltaproteobacteria bacterium]|jgi:2,3-bisphosphoglycerate-independent phosphoglycerate mutase|nr:cofactor-independent phosphoglycerate mutase [Deltaproteobacteria bacterium]